MPATAVVPPHRPPRRRAPGRVPGRPAPATRPAPWRPASPSRAPATWCCGRPWRSRGTGAGHRDSGAAGGSATCAPPDWATAAGVYRRRLGQLSTSRGSDVRRRGGLTTPVGRLSAATPPALVLPPVDGQPVGLLVHGGAESGAGGPEPAPHPGGVGAGGQAGVAELQLQGERLQPDRTVPVEGDQEQQAEVVAQPRVDPVVVQEVTQVVQDLAGDP